MFLRKLFSQFFIAKCFKRSLLFNIELIIPKKPVFFVFQILAFLAGK